MRFILVFIVLIFSGEIFGQVDPRDYQPCYEHLYTVNAAWRDQSRPSVWHERVMFTGETERIAYHLHVVADQLSERHRNDEVVQGLMTQLHAYADRGQFPINTQYPGRRPVFIDERGVACAVGQLMLDNGFEAEAHQVQRTMNHAFIREIPEEWLLEWMNASHLSVYELALIQPSYPLGIPWTNHGNNLEGTVHDLLVHNGVLYVAGELTLSGISRPVLKWNGTSFAPASFSLTGAAFDLHVEEGVLLAGGRFGSAGNVAQFNESTVTLFELNEGVADTIRCFESDPVSTFVAASLTDGSGDAVFFPFDPEASLTDGSGDAVFFPFDPEASADVFARTNGHVHVLTMFDGDLFIGGSFSQIWHDFETEPTLAQNLARTDGYTFTEQAYPNEIFSLKRLYDHLVVTSRFDAPGSHEGGWAIFDGVDWWEQIIPFQSPGTQANLALYSCVGYDQGWLLTGDFHDDTSLWNAGDLLWMGNFGSGTSPQAVEDFEMMCEPMMGSIRTVAWFEGRLYAGGDFQGGQGTTSVNQLMSTDAFTGLERNTAASLLVFPNPTADQVQVSIPPEMSGATLRILDVAGTVVVEQAAHPGIVSVDVSSLSSGSYFIQLEGETGIRSARMLKVD